jgi:hypothetical protein
LARIPTAPKEGATKWPGWSRPRRARASIVLRRPHRGGHLQSPQAALAPEFPRRAVEHPPQSLGAFLLAKAAYTRLGPEKAGVRASRPRSSTRKARMAFLTLCEAHPRSWAIFGGEFPRGLARRIWHRRIPKASPARSPASRLSRSFSDSSRTKIGGFMQPTIAHYTPPSLRMH